MTKLAQLISIIEGGFRISFGQMVGVPGTIPFERNNPGDLRHSPHSTHPADDPNGIGHIDTLEHGWEDLERQLNLYAQRGCTLGQSISAWAPPIENDTAAYLNFVVNGFNGRVHAETALSQVLLIQADAPVPEVTT